MQRQQQRLTSNFSATSTTNSKGEREVRQQESFSVLHGTVATDIGNRRGPLQQSPAKPFTVASETERVRAKLTALSRGKPQVSLDRCTADRAPDAHLRSLAWEVDLECLGRDFRNWATEATTQRQEYDIWRAKYLGSDEMRERDSVELGNQADSAESHLDPAFQHIPIRKIIIEDVNRTLSENELFGRDDIKCILKRVLYVYARLNPSIGYAQGMNEILAPILYVLHRDATYVAEHLAGCGEEEDARVALMEGEYIRARTPADLADWEVRGVARCLCRLDALENDAFRLFSRVMRTVGPWFHTPKINDEKYANAYETEIITKCTRTNELLRMRDPMVYNQLKSMDVDPETYLPKWIKILFAQMFPLESLLQVWDALFATGIASEPYDLVDHICVTLLVLIRTSCIIIFK